MRKLKFILPAMVLVSGFMVSSVSYAKPEYTKKEKGAKCTVCHTKGKELNKVGECYKTTKSLKECEPEKK